MTSKTHFSINTNCAGDVTRTLKSVGVFLLFFFCKNFEFSGVFSFFFCSGRLLPPTDRYSIPEMYFVVWNLMTPIKQ